MDEEQEMAAAINSGLSHADAHPGDHNASKQGEGGGCQCRLCRALAALKALSEQPGLEPVAEILSINPGVALDQEAWTYIGFKGGSEPGVLNLNWLLQRADGRWFVLTAGLNDTERNIPLNEPLALLESAAQLLAEA